MAKLTERQLYAAGRELAERSVVYVVSEEHARQLVAAYGSDHVLRYERRAPGMWQVAEVISVDGAVEDLDTAYPSSWRKPRDA
jgi:hypothetical protein